MEEEKNKRDGLAVASMVLGIVSFVFGFIIIIPILAIIFGILGRKSNKKGMATAGIWTGGITLVLTIIFMILVFIGIGFTIFNSIDLFEEARDSRLQTDWFYDREQEELTNQYTYNSWKNTYYGMGYTLEYDDDWEELTNLELPEGVQLVYEGSLTIFNTINVSLSSTDIDVTTYLGRSRLYSDMRTGLDSANEFYITSNSYGFLPLKDDVYYAYYDAEKIGSSEYGRFYVIVSEENDLLICLGAFGINESYFKQNEYMIREMIDSIELY